MVEAKEAVQSEIMFPDYYPITVGNRWVYRNPDGSEWAREVAGKQIGSYLTFHVIHYDPPIEDSRSDFLESPVYATTPYRLELSANNNSINDAVWRTILRSGGDDPDWHLSHTFDGGVWQSSKAEGAFVYLKHYRTRVVRHGDFVLLRFPLVSGQTYKVLNMKLNGSRETLTSFHSFEASGVISASVGHPEPVETRAGTFENCLRIQYRGDLQSVKTTEFQHLVPLPLPVGVSKGFVRLLESEIHKELVDLMKSVILELGLETVWLAPGVGPVKIERADGIAELIDFEIK
ncbi:MAG: hypothetical protein OXI86_00460 [Candidatus Poribacteria bacterium]|nr:hypothetical protein [Candidatus Poribacteria bacterium]